MTLSFIIAAYYGFYFAAMAIFVIYAPPAFESLGFSVWSIGVLMAITPLVRFLTPFFLSSYAIDTRLFKIGMIGSLICTMIAPLFLEPFWLFCIFFFVFSIFWTIGLPFVDALAMDTIGKAKYGKVRLFGSIGFALCALAIGELELLPINLWICYAALYTGAVFIGIYAVKSYSPSHYIKQKLSAINASKEWRFWLSIFAFQLSFGPFYAFYSIYCLDHGFSKADISYLWAFGVFCEILMFWLQAPIVQKYSAQTLFIVATATAIPRWLIVWLYPDNLFLAFVAQSIHAFNLALYMTVAFALLGAKYKDLHLSKLYFYGIGYGLGGFFGSLIGGKIYGTHIFAFSAFCAIIATVVILKGNQHAMSKL